MPIDHRKTCAACQGGALVERPPEGFTGVLLINLWAGFLVFAAFTVCDPLAVDPETDAIPIAERPATGQTDTTARALGRHLCPAGTRPFKCVVSVVVLLVEDRALPGPEILNTYLNFKLRPASRVRPINS